MNAKEEGTERVSRWMKWWSSKPADSPTLIASRRITCLNIFIFLFLTSQGEWRGSAWRRRFCEWTEGDPHKEEDGSAEARPLSSPAECLVRERRRMKDFFDSTGCDRLEDREFVCKKANKTNFEVQMRKINIADPPNSFRTICGRACEKNSLIDRST